MRPTVEFQTIDHGIEGWDETLTANFGLLAALFSGPVPPGPEYPSPASIPAADEHDGCIAVATDPVAGSLLHVSDGASWSAIGKQAEAHPDSSADTVTDLRAEFNGLLAKLRASGVLAT